VNRAQPETAPLGIQESPIEREIVRNQNSVSEKLFERGNYFRRVGAPEYHRRGDSRKSRYAIWYRFTRINKLAEIDGLLVLQESHGAYLDQPVTGGIDTCGFGIGNNKRTIDGDHEVCSSA